MTIPKYLELQPSRDFAAKKFVIGAVSRPMSSQETGGRFTPTAIRIRALRRSSAYPERAQFADFLGISGSRLSNVENGFPISRDLENIIVSKMPWISGDWLQRGNEALLTGATLQRLLPLLAEESDTTAPRSRSKAKAGR